MNCRTFFGLLSIYVFTIFCCLSDGADITTDATRRSTSENANSIRTSFRANLQYVFVLTRHGSRTPLETYPTDPYPYTDLTFWPEGPGQLTKFGKRQLFQTGRSLRRRYKNFLSSNYYFNETAARANVFDRDYMSAATLLAGLYPPSGYQMWNKDIPWQPIPIWEDRRDIADLLGDPQSCPRFYAAQAKALDEANQESNKHQQLLEYLSEHSQQKITYCTKILQLWDTFTVQQENGYELPDWAKEVYPEKMAELEGKAFKAFTAGNIAMVRLDGGALFEMIMNQFNSKAKGTLDPDRKLFVEAAHDATLRVLMTGLGIEETFPIDTSAYIVIELYNLISAHHVKLMYFNNSATTTPRILEIPSCGNFCALSEFNTVLRNVIPENYKAECEDLDSNF